MGLETTFFQGLIILLVLFACLLMSLQPEHTNVCFWYIPQSLRGVPDSPERREKLHRVCVYMASLVSSNPLWVPWLLRNLPPMCFSDGEERKDRNLGWALHEVVLSAILVVFLLGVHCPLVVVQGGVQAASGGCS